MTKQIEPSTYYETGWSAALHGDTIDSCKLLKHNRRADWLNGFNNATQKMESAPKKLTGKQKETNQKNITGLIAFLDK